MYRGEVNQQKNEQQGDVGRKREEIVMEIKKTGSCIQLLKQLHSNIVGGLQKKTFVSRLTDTTVAIPKGSEGTLYVKDIHHTSGWPTQLYYWV